MQNVPKIVTDRLRAGAVAVEHPDADVLTAFSERSLPERESNSVMEHLARCSDCREIVALALPEGGPAEEVARQPSGGWLTWPVMRWGLVAAGIVVVASAGIVRYRQYAARSQNTARYYNAAPAEGVAKEAKNRPEPLPAAPEAAKLQDTVAPPPVSQPKFEDSKTSAGEGLRADLDQLKAPATRDEKSVGGPVTLNRRNLTFGPSVRQQMQQNNNFYANNSQVVQTQAPQVQIPQNQVSPSPVPPGLAKQEASDFAANAPTPAAKAAGVGAGSAQSNTVAQNQEALVLPSTSLPMQPSGGHAEMVERAKPSDPLPGTKVPASADSPSQLYRYSTSDLYGPKARWSINSAGALQRSVDQGRTWQDVSVSSGAVGGLLSLHSEKAPARAKAPEKDKADKKVNEAPAPIVFRAVAANGADVWAGGTAGLLYHSTDSGVHWTRVVPFSAGVVLTGDIVSLEFSDPQHGRVVTSVAQVWTTADGGLTWQKQ